MTVRVRFAGSAHVLPVLRAAILGWVTLKVFFSYIGRPISIAMNGWAFDWLNVTLPGHPLVMMWATDLHNFPTLALGGLASGWIVGRLGGHQTRTVVIVATMMAAGLLSQAVYSAVNPPTPGYTNHASLPLFILLQAFTPSAAFFAGALSATRPRRA